MPKFLLVPLLTALFSSSALMGQSAKNRLQVPMLASDPVIDGRLDEELWNQSATIEQLQRYFPDSSASQATLDSRVYLFYTPKGLYVAAEFTDPESPVLAQLTERDQYNGNTDWMHLRINPFNDGANDFNFYLTAAGVQADSRSTPAGSDFGWNGVWESAVYRETHRWTAEVFIPYRVLRIPHTPAGKQPAPWGFNIVRSRRSDRSNYSWNYIDRNFDNESLQCGLLEGIAVEHPPKRINLRPNATVSLSRDEGGPLRQLGTAGADIKVGLNKSFTLDMTLLPDFSQVAYDQQFINFSAFEQQFDENRQFFKEGLNLFDKGNLFYSRRIGGNPENFTNNNLSTLSNTTQSFTRMLNATKLTGTTDQNLSLGVLNAVTAANYASGFDSLGLPVQLLTEPLTNYNVVAADQRIAGNSSIGMINTSVVRQNTTGPTRDARTTALTANLNFLDNSHFANVIASQSSITDIDQPYKGHQLLWNVGRQQGAWRWDHNFNLTTASFDPNDMGFLQRGNSLHQNFRVAHHLLQPTRYYLRRRNSLRVQYRRLYQPNVFERVHLDFSHFGLTKSFFAYGYDLEVRPKEYDFFDPRVWGRYRINPASMWHNAWISTDYRKPLAVDAGGGFWRWADWGAHGAYANVGVIYRASDRLNFNARVDLGNHHQIGWAQTVSADSVGMALRHNREFAQSLRGQYLFGPNSYLNLNLRHNWNRVHSLERFHLEQTGGLLPSEAYEDPNLNVNIFNMDLKFVWWFAPGRELNVLYRASLAHIDGEWDKKYLNNLLGLQDEQANQILSLRLVYFLDYAEVVQNTKLNR